MFARNHQVGEEPSPRKSKVQDKFQLEEEKKWKPGVEMETHAFNEEIDRICEESDFDRRVGQHTCQPCDRSGVISCDRWVDPSASQLWPVRLDPDMGLPCGVNKVNNLWLTSKPSVLPFLLTEPGGPCHGCNGGFMQPSMSWASTNLNGMEKQFYLWFPAQRAWAGDRNPLPNCHKQTIQIIKPAHDHSWESWFSCPSHCIPVPPISYVSTADPLFFESQPMVPYFWIYWYLYGTFCYENGATDPLGELHGSSNWGHLLGTTPLGSSHLLI